MPLHTPSPHRFLAPHPPSAQKSKPKPPSNLRNGFALDTFNAATTGKQTPELQFKQLPPAKRFVITPHRRTQSAEGHGKDEVYDKEAWGAQTQSTPRPKPRRKFERVESIEEPQSSPAALEEDSNSYGVAQSIEQDPMFTESKQQEAEGDDDEILFVTEERNKRRRVSPPSSFSFERPSEPSTPVPAHNATTHRFLVPPPRTPAPFGAVGNLGHDNAITPGSTIVTTPATHRPAFLLPPQPTSPPKPSKPLPEIFSPSRKIGKYIPDGLASTMQGWIIETANTGFAAHERGVGVVWGRDREDGVRLKVRISAVSSSSGAGCGNGEEQQEAECFPGHFVFIRGDTVPGLYNASRAPSLSDDDRETRVLLAGQGGARGTGGVRIKVGGIVGIRAPMWDVDVGGEKWSVGVDWVVL
jgi:hypothetical protein